MTDEGQEGQDGKSVWEEENEGESGWIVQGEKKCLRDRAGCPFGVEATCSLTSSLKKKRIKNRNGKLN